MKFSSSVKIIGYKIGISSMGVDAPATTPMKSVLVSMMRI